MALVNSLYLRGAKQKLAGAVFYQQAGRTIARELAAEVSNPRTPSQMGQRVKWANLVKFYQANKGWMKKAFENKKPTQSDYNKFMQMNVPYGRVYLTKTEAAAGACIVDAYRIADGSLPPVGITETDGYWVTNINVGKEFSLSSETTVGELSSTLISSNPTLRAGDQLSFIRVTQTTDKLGIPRIQVRTYEMLLNVNSPSLVEEFLPLEVLMVSMLEDESQVLSVDNNGNMGAFAIIVSRTTGSKTLVSTADLTLVNMGEFLSTYTSAIQLEKAAASYGVSEEVFLDSDNAQPFKFDPTSLSMMYAKVGDDTLVQNEGFVKVADLVGKRLSITFNKPVQLNQGDRMQIRDQHKHNVNIAPQVDGNTVFADITDAKLGSLVREDWVLVVNVILSDWQYEFYLDTDPMKSE